MSDQAARDRIVSDLDTNLLVEAGAGSGKTTGLVNRLCALVTRGIPVEQLAAVTFTRKAAAELRERFQLRLEQDLQAEAPGARRDRLDAALRNLDRSFVGTIHSFAARMLREQALDAGVDPGFEELDEAAMRADQERFWQHWLDRARRDGHPGPAELRALGLDPRDLLDAFMVVAGNPDVAWPDPGAPAPDPAHAIGRLRKLAGWSWSLMPAEEPAAGWDELQRLVRQLHFVEQTRGIDQLADAMHALGLVTASRCKVTQNRWSSLKEGKEAAKELEAAWREFLDGTVTPLLGEWRAHRYGPVVRFVAEAAREYERERRRTGRVGFEDLLAGVTRLLREAPGVRAALGERYRHLLVDEFQDTDPLQAELCFLLASPPGEGTDWRRVRPRPGALFVVGDPKQSIYRFRRADLRTYEAARECLARVGDVIRLTRNFRSAVPIAEVVNAHFAGVFPAGPSPVQAPFAPLESDRAPEGDDGVARYRVVPADGRGKKASIVAADAALLAGSIAARIEAGQNTAGDFLVLTERKAELADYATALAAHNVPVVTSGAELRQEHELTELVLLLRLLADPGNPVLLVAVLEGIFAGLDPGQLYAAQRGGLRLQLDGAAGPGEGPVAAALERLRGWWQLSRRLPPDQLLDRLLDDTGLLPWAASQPLGEERAGALLHLVESVRGSARGMTDLRGMITVLEESLAAEDGAPVLRPDRSDAVRVMNLHKAKGLEADVVVLAAPVPAAPREPSLHITRGDGATATGWLQVGVGEGRSREVLAEPPGWDRMSAAEAALLEAERDRLLYVAATRARRLLLVAERGDGKEAGLWARLSPVLAGRAPLDIAPRATPGRRRLEGGAAPVQARAAAAAVAREARAEPTLTVESVTRSLRQDLVQQRAYDLPPDAGEFADARARGDAIHRVLEALGRGRRGESLARFALAVVRDQGLPDDALAQVLAAVDGVTGQPEWQDLQAGRAEYELPIMLAEEVNGTTRITEGVMDAVGQRPDGAWRVVDWKSGRVDGEAWQRKLPRYQEQVDRYQEMLQAAGLRAEGATVVRVRGA